MPERVWKSYIDNEIDNKEYDYVRKLYNQLLSDNKHVKIWMSYA